MEYITVLTKVQLETGRNRRHPTIVRAQAGLSHFTGSWWTPHADFAGVHDLITLPHGITQAKATLRI